MPNYLPITDPQILLTHRAFAELEPALEEFGRAQGMALTRGHSNPRRELRRRTPTFLQKLTFDLTPRRTWEERERGFYPEIPCTMIFSADILTRPQRHYILPVFEAVPYDDVRHSLPWRLLNFLPHLAAATHEFVAERGVENEELSRLMDEAWSSGPSNRRYARLAALIERQCALTLR